MRGGWVFFLRPQSASRDILQRFPNKKSLLSLFTKIFPYLPNIPRPPTPLTMGHIGFLQARHIWFKKYLWKGTWTSYYLVKYSGNIEIPLGACLHEGELFL